MVVYTVEDTYKKRVSKLRYKKNINYYISQWIKVPIFNLRVKMIIYIFIDEASDRFKA